MTEQKNFKDLQLGFDRTQLFKEYVQDQINRSTALRTTIEYCTLHNIKLDVEITMLMTKRFVEYLETGDTSWMKKMETYLQEEKLKQIEYLNQ